MDFWVSLVGYSKNLLVTNTQNFYVFIDRLLNDKGLPQEVKVRIVNILAAAALKDDVILLLHQDRKDHVLMNYAFDIDRHSTEEQIAIALLVR